jgi:hypothetical protein
MAMLSKVTWATPTIVAATVAIAIVGVVIVKRGAREDIRRATDAMLIERAAAVVHDDPTLAVTLLKDVDRAWTAARPIAAAAAIGGIAMLLPVPEGMLWLALDEQDNHLVAATRERCVVYALAPAPAPANEKPRWIATPGIPIRVVGSAVLSSQGRTVFLTDIATGAQRTFVADGDVWNVSAAPTGAWIAASTDTHVVVWSASGDRSLVDLPDVNALAVSNRGVVVAATDTALVVVERGAIHTALPPGAVVDISPDAEVALVRDELHETVWLFTLADRALKRVTLPARGLVIRDGHTIFELEADAIVEWSRGGDNEWRAGMRQERLPRGARGPAWLANGIAYREPNARMWRRLETVHRTTTRDGLTSFAQVLDGTLRRFSHAREAERCAGSFVAFAGGSKIVEVGGTGELAICDLRDGRRRPVVASSTFITRALASPSGRYLAAESIVWDLDMGTQQPIEAGSTPIAIDDRRLIVEREAQLFEVELATMRSVRRCEKQKAAASPLLRAVGTRVVAAANEHGVSVCELATGSIRTLGDVPGTIADRVAIAPDDSAVIASQGTALVHWNLATGARHVLEVPFLLGEEPRFAFADDGSFVVAGPRVAIAYDRDVRERARFPLREPPLVPEPREEEPRALRYHELAVSPDGKRFAMARSSFSLAIYDIATKRGFGVPETYDLQLELRFVPGGIVASPPKHRPLWIADDVPDESLAAWLRNATNAILVDGRLAAPAALP